MLDEFPSYEECKDAVNNMKKEKSPGYSFHLAKLGYDRGRLTYLYMNIH